MNKVLKDTVIKIKKIDYFRDLGGLYTADGRKIKKGLLYRSSHLSNISYKTQKMLEEKYNIGEVIDLRSSEELIDKPEAGFFGVGYFPIAPLTDKDNPAVNRKTRDTILKKLMAKNGGTNVHLQGIYAKLASLPEANEAYGDFFRHLLNSDKAIIYHCTQGKDRTGVASALILLALGVKENDIMEDYLYYNKVTGLTNNLYAFLVASVYFSPHKGKELKNLLIARKEYLTSFFEEIRLHGGIDTYLNACLGLSSDDIKKLKDKYLE